MVAGGLDITAVRRWAWAARDGLREHRDLVNALNIFPSPDHDTGSNMLRFWEAFACGLLGVPDDMPVGDALSLSATQCLDVEGNSVTLAYGWLTGLGESLHGLSTVETDRLATAFGDAAVRARSCLTTPVEGTMLTVFDAAARTWEPTLAGGATEAETTARVDRSVHEALAGHAVPRHAAWRGEGPAEDAGAFAVRVVLHAMTRVMAGPGSGPVAPLYVPLAPHPPAGDPAGEPGCEVQAIVRAEDSALRALGADTRAESVVIAPIPLHPGRWHLHFHTASATDPQAVLDRSGITVVEHRITPLRPRRDVAPGLRRTGGRTLLHAQSSAGIGGRLDAAVARGADEIVLVVAGGDAGNEAGEYLSEARFRNPGLAAALIPGQDETGAAAAAGAFSVAGELGDVVLAMFTAAQESRRG